MTKGNKDDNQVNNEFKINFHNSTEFFYILRNHEAFYSAMSPRYFGKYHFRPLGQPWIDR